MSGRIMRGFLRLGAFLAALCFIAASIPLIIEAQSEKPVRPSTMLPPGFVLDKTDSKDPRTSSAVPIHSDEERAYLRAQEGSSARYLVAELFGVAGIVVFFLSVSVGWVFSGFFKP